MSTLKPSQEALLSNNIEKLKELILSNTEENLYNPNMPGRTILHDAVINDNIDIVKIIIENVPDKVFIHKYTTGNHHTPLHRAAYWNKLEICQ
jgi:ankyrin repeat protein